LVGVGAEPQVSAAMALAKGQNLEKAAREAARVASDAVRYGLTEIGAGDGPVDVLHLKGAA
jgi:hydroxymethylpyrimidine/phosphomethylpyrimidine kinase